MKINVDTTWIKELGVNRATIYAFLKATPSYKAVEHARALGMHDRAIYTAYRILQADGFIKRSRKGIRCLR